METDLPPSNDAFERRLRRDSSAEFLEADNSLATAEPGEPAHPTGASAHSVWYEWKTPEAGIAKFQLGGNTGFSIYKGDTLATLQLVTNNFSPSGCLSSLALAVGSNSIYQIGMDRCSDVAGSSTATIILNRSSRIQFVRPQSDGSVEIGLIGEPGRSYSIQGSIDLNHWVDLFTADDAPFSYVDREAGAYRIYRAVQVR